MEIEDIFFLPEEIRRLKEIKDKKISKLTEEEISKKKGEIERLTKIVRQHTKKEMTQKINELKKEKTIRAVNLKEYRIKRDEIKKAYGASERSTLQSLKDELKEYTKGQRWYVIDIGMGVSIRTTEKQLMKKNSPYIILNKWLNLIDKESENSQGLENLRDFVELYRDVAGGYESRDNIEYPILYEIAGNTIKPYFHTAMKKTNQVDKEIKNLKL